MGVKDFGLVLFVVTLIILEEIEYPLRNPEHNSTMSKFNYKPILPLKTMKS